MRPFKELRAPSDHVLGRIKHEAFAALSAADAARCHLSVVPRIYPAGHELRLVDRKLVVPEDAVTVFVDEMPGANFGHPCRYRFHSPETGLLLHEEPANFPPEVADRDTTVELFHAPRRMEAARPKLYGAVDWSKVRPFPWATADHNRIALLFTSQISNRRHVEDVEFAWRTLRHRFGFPAGNIYVLCFDGTIGAVDATSQDLQTWAGDDTAYQMQVYASATKQHLQDAINAIGARMNEDTLLFVHTNNHGSPSGLCIDNQSVLTPSEWGTMLAGMPKFGALVVTMEQCYAGAFSSPTLTNSRAKRTSFASAVPADKVSWGALHFDPWAQAWFEAVNGFTVHGGALPASPDANHNGRISVREAFDYSDAHDTATGDDPQYADSPVGCGHSIYLTRQPSLWDLIRELSARYELIAAEIRHRPPLPDPPPFAERDLLAALQAADGLIEKLGVKLPAGDKLRDVPAIAAAARQHAALATNGARPDAA